MKFPQFSKVVQDALTNLPDLGNPFVRDGAGAVVLRFDEIRLDPTPEGVDLGYRWSGHTIYTQRVTGVTISGTLTIRGIQGTTTVNAI